MLLGSSSQLGSFEGSPESVDMTVKELEQNLLEVKQATSGSSKTSLAHAKVVGIPCDVCNPENVQNLANFAVSELGSIDIWVSALVCDAHFLNKW